MIKASLRTKFLLVMSTLLFAAVFMYLILAISLFNEDKTTYIYEGNATLVSTLASETETKLTGLKRTLNLIASTVNQGLKSNSATRSARKLFTEEDNIVSFNLYNADNSKKSIKNFSRVDFLKPHNLKKDYFDYVYKEAKISFDNLFKRGTTFQNTSLKSGIALMTIATVHSSKDNDIYDQVIIAHLRLDRQIKLFSRSETFNTYLIDSYGHILVHQDPSKVIQKASIAGSEILNLAMKSKIETGVKEANGPDGALIFGYSKLKLGNLIVVSEISKEKAFLASKRLIEKSILFALLIISCSFIVSLLFSKKITSSLRKLYHATQEIMQGNFSVSVDVQSADEVGALSSSFNKMAGEISRLMDETADKARMEKELETAQLVQDNFFPIDQVDLGEFEIAAYYEPASECGGDWWSHFIIDGKLILLIGDATGHGVPSALITAAAQSCCTTLESMNADLSGLNLSPQLILEKLNTSICRAGRGSVKMTFFVAVVDMESGHITYSNASHDMPMLCHTNPDDPQAARKKKDIEVCKGKTGMILGHDESSTFPEHTIEMGAGEVLTLYTDGVVECKNEQDEMFGKGRFLRTFFKSANKSAKDIRDDIMSEANEFYGDRERDDDVTLVILRRKPKAQSSQKAS